MPKIKFKPLFERSLREQAVMVSDRLRQVECENLRRGLYNIYRNELCTSSDLMIRQYRDRKELVRVDVVTGLTVTVRVL